MKTKQRYCTERSCPANSNGSTIVPYEILGIVKPNGLMADHFHLKCTRCGYETFDVVPKVSRKKRTWPHYNESAGVTFESDSHEQKYTKANNLTAE